VSKHQALQARPAAELGPSAGGLRAFDVSLTARAVVSDCKPRHEIGLHAVSTFATARPDNTPEARRRGGFATVDQDDRAMTQSKTSDELYSEQRRQRAAELIAAIVRKRRRVTTDEALLDQEALREAAGRAARRERESID
jgi:hypothetical protein